MLCTDFEEHLTDYLDGTLSTEAHSIFAAHALRCPVCHETLTQVRNTVDACKMASVPPPPRDLEALILQETAPELSMSCDDFEDFLTDYLDGFLPAPLFHRWERHAVLCARCTELPGEVVRSIGACYSYLSEELPIAVDLNARILQATIGTLHPQEMRAPISSRLASWLRGWLDPIVSPQLATVATMLLMAIFVLSNTVSADGSIGGVYQASLRLAEQSYAGNSDGGLRGLTDGLKELVGGQRAQDQPGAGGNQLEHSNSNQKEQPTSDHSTSSGTKPSNSSGQNNR